MIPEQILKQIQDRLDIVEVIGAALPLKRAGRHYKALCPFHGEKTPSFMVNPTKQIFHCFGCGEGGDAIAFVMKFERVEFLDAVRSLAGRAGVALPPSSGASPSRPSETTQLLAALEFATACFQRTLQSPAGAAAQQYLAQRGVSAASVTALRLGYADDRWDALLTAAQAGGVRPEMIERAGLAVAREGGHGWYDRFRGRLMFPVWDPKGKVVGFGGRVLDDAQPKYMNSPETEIYTKSRIVYGLHLAAPHIRDQDAVAIVEGYLDFLIPYQLGVRHLVASMGTSLTADQVAVLRRYTRRVIMVYDGDYAGELATLRGLDLLLAEGMSVRIVPLPPGEDPDSAAQRLGAEGFRRLLADAQDLFTYKLELLRRRHDASTVEGKVAICEQLLPTIRRVPNAPQASEYLRTMAEALKLREEDLRLEIVRLRLDGPAGWRPRVGPPGPALGDPAERMLLGLLVDDPRMMERALRAVTPEMIQDPRVREAFGALVAGLEGGDAGVNGAAQRLRAGAAASLVAQALMLVESLEDRDRALDDCLRRIRQGVLRRRQMELQSQMQAAESRQDEGELASLIGEYNQLVRAEGSP